jgi:hypothetical protein
MCLNIIRLILLLITVALFMTVGMLALLKPDIAGGEFYLVKYKKFYLIKNRKTSNKYYEKQIRIVGVGLLGATIISTVAYVIMVLL